MYEYHGWLSTLESLDANNILKDLKKINGDYPVSAQYVNGNLHISFSGNPNRDQGQLDNLITYIRDLKGKLYGCLYINDANSDRYNKFDVIKIVEDKIIKTEDKNFTDAPVRGAHGFQYGDVFCFPHHHHDQSAGNVKSRH